MDQKQDYIVCISGERNSNTQFKKKIKQQLTKYQPSLVLVGDCSGVDEKTIEVCHELNIAYKVFYAQWDCYGNEAGPKRNAFMLKQNPNILLAFHSNFRISHNTNNCIIQALRMKIDVETFSLS
jgi:hypothetical protein